MSPRLADRRARSSSAARLSGPPLQDLLELLLSLGVRSRSARAFDFLGERVAGAQTGAVEIDGAAQVGDARLELAA